MQFFMKKVIYCLYQCGGMNLSYFLASLLIASSIIMIVSSHWVYAAVVNCVQIYPDACHGTNDSDVMKGSQQPNRILGEDGNDKIFGLDGNDELRGGNGDDTLQGGDGAEGGMLGEDGNDKIYGGPGGDDELIGGPGNDLVHGGDGNDVNLAGDVGSDVLFGDAGDDAIAHGAISGVTDPRRTLSDGSQDKIDCGPGNDVAWINVNTDHDTAKNCETVHTEND